MIMKKKIPTIIIYIITTTLMLLPWVPLGDRCYNLIQFAMLLLKGEVFPVVAEMGVEQYLAFFRVIVPVQTILCGIYCVGAVVYVISSICGKSWRINFVNTAIAVTNIFIIGSGLSMISFGTANALTMLVPPIICLLSTIEIPFCFFSERWEETVKETKEYEAQEKEFKEEKERRLRFDGKYTKQFYHIVRKNFRRNWKDYILLLICNIMIFTCFIIGYGLQRLLSNKYNQPQIGMLDGMGVILKNAMVPMGILYIFIMVMLIFYYIKCRARNYGVFLTLGMRRKTLYYFVALEYGSVFLVSLLVGGVIGTAVLMTFVNNSEDLIGIAVTFSKVGFMPYIEAIVSVFGITVLSMMAARDIFQDFNVGKSTDLRAIGEKMPMHFRKVLISIGVVICGFMVLRYSNRDNYENANLLLGTFVGLFLILRYGMAEYLFRGRRTPKYMKKMLPHNQLFHKSRTSTGYIGVFAVMQVCVLFYFSFQLISANIAEEPESLYPYDIVCRADEKDNDFFEELEEKYQLEMYEYPALRVSVYDSTEEDDGMSRPVQGQHIGISESTYHQLKKYMDSSYEAEPLGLKGEEIYIVYQQDKSVKAHPLGYDVPRSKVLAHVGLPCVYVDVLGQGSYGYARYKVKGEEFGSLIGIFRQGIRENIVVFGDEYFEEAKEFWKTTNIRSGDKIEYPGQGLEHTNPFIYQGMTKLVLMNVLGEQQISTELQEELELFEARHIEEEDTMYRTVDPLRGAVYDLSVSYHYLKEDGIVNLKMERVMKIAVNTLIIVLFFAMTLVLMLVKMLSELDMNQQKAEFLKRMGMRKKERVRLAKREIFRYFYMIPTVIGVFFSIIFTVVLFGARMYTQADISNYLVKMIPLWGVYLAVLTVAMWIMVTIYERWIEKHI